MSKKFSYLTFITLFIIIVGFAACQQKEQPKLTPDNYRSWSKTVETLLDYPIPGHESNCRIIYINAKGENVRPTEKNGRLFYAYPEGTIVVKEIYRGLKQPKEDETPIKLSVMIKDSQHPQSQSGWLWIVTIPANREERIIDHNLCVDCHTNANEPHPYGDKNPNSDFRDFVYFPPQH